MMAYCPIFRDPAQNFAGIFDYHKFQYPACKISFIFSWSSLKGIHNRWALLWDMHSLSLTRWAYQVKNDLNLPLWVLAWCTCNAITRFAFVCVYFVTQFANKLNVAAEIFPLIPNLLWDRCLCCKESCTEWTRHRVKFYHRLVLSSPLHLQLYTVSSVF